MNSNLLHPLTSSADLSALRLNDPFDYVPHPLVVEASQQIECQLKRMSDDDTALSQELANGKMLGVLVVRTKGGEIGFLAAFSGMLAGKTVVDYFVPPIYDLNSNYYRGEEQRISEISQEIARLRNNEKYLSLRTKREQLEIESKQIIAKRREEYASAKEQRAKERLTTNDQQILTKLQRESQHQKAEIHREQLHFHHQLAKLDEKLQQWQSQISALEESRANESQLLQRRLFESYRMVNGRGEWRSLYTIFDDLYHRLPPSGTGECAAPKMLHYALCNDLTPIAMGEFWHGAAPKSEVRHNGVFYGSCRGKCEPILKFVLQGIELMPSTRIEKMEIERYELKILYDDNDLAVVEKPAGMLSVPGRELSHSVESEVRRLFPSIEGAVMVHRLDQDTSGIMVVAKRAEIHKALQRQFALRTMTKRYIAIVNGIVDTPQGEISLPLSANYEDRPRQKVDDQEGKEAHTTYEVLRIDHEFNQSRLALYPHTGRTHQLRVHTSHHDGLSAPIVGDSLYGKSLLDERGSRLMLHAEQIVFRHPTTGEEVNISSPAPF